MNLFYYKDGFSKDAEIQFHATSHGKRWYLRESQTFSETRKFSISIAIGSPMAIIGMGKTNDDLLFF